MAETLEIELGRIYPSDVNVRQDVGDITELIDSVESKGILEPVIVRPSDGDYEVVVEREGSRQLGLPDWMLTKILLAEIPNSR